MKLKKLGPNMTELEFADGTRLLVSYEIPCAVYLGSEAVLNPEGVRWLVTDKYFSRSTRQHINKWIPAGAPVKRVPQEDIDAIVEGR